MGRGGGSANSCPLVPEGVGQLGARADPISIFEKLAIVLRRSGVIGVQRDVFAAANCFQM